MKGLLNQTRTPTPQQGLGKEDLASFAQQIISSIPKSETVVIQGQYQKVRADEDVEVRVDELGEMNKRVVNKMVEGTDVSGIKYKEEVKKDDIISIIDELEGLLEE